MKKNMIRIAAFAAILLAVSACIYPYDPVIEGFDSRLVVEGDIHIGSTSTFTFSRVLPLDSDDYTPDPLFITGYIEGEDGSRVTSVNSHLPYYDYSLSSNRLVFDTSGLTADKRYRLHFEESNSGSIYESDWLEVIEPPTIDDLTYILDEDRGELNVALSMHCNGHSHFRWYYKEEWEFHTDLWADYYYIPETDELVQFPVFENTYYCWSTYNSPEIKIFSTEEQVEDRFVDLEFHRVARTNTRLQIVYHIIVYLEALDENAYKYWQNIQSNSDGQGTIFSPTPSQMTGNIHCVSDPSVPVIGYIGASSQCSGDMYYINAEEHFYKSPTPTPVEILEIQPPEFADYYRRGYLPVEVISSMGSATRYEWAPARCVDCRRKGGTKNKPEGWPNDHR